MNAIDRRSMFKVSCDYPHLSMREYFPLTFVIREGLHCNKKKGNMDEIFALNYIMFSVENIAT